MVPSPYSLDGEGGRGGAAEVAAELALLGNLLQQRVACDLLRARAPQGHLALAGGGHRHRRRIADAGRRLGARLRRKGRATDGSRTRLRERDCDHGRVVVTASRGVPTAE